MISQGNAAVLPAVEDDDRTQVYQRPEASRCADSTVLPPPLERHEAGVEDVDNRPTTPDPECVPTENSPTTEGPVQHAVKGNNHEASPQEPLGKRAGPRLWWGVLAWLLIAPLVRAARAVENFADAVLGHTTIVEQLPPRLRVVTLSSSPSVPITDGVGEAILHDWLFRLPPDWLRAIALVARYVEALHLHEASVRLVARVHLALSRLPADADGTVPLSRLRLFLPGIERRELDRALRCLEDEGVLVLLPPRAGEDATTAPAIADELRGALTRVELRSPA
jgi:hypothetical protein